MRIPHHKFSMTPRQQGIVLLEALIAVLLFSMGVLALVGLQAAMMKNTDDAKFRAEASFLAQQSLGEMWADPDPNTLATKYAVLNNSNPRFNISNLLPNGTRTIQVGPLNNNSVQVTVNISWQQPGKDPHRYTTIANISGG